MKLSENPIFITHKRLVHRGGVLAAVLIAGLVGASLLAGLISYLANPRHLNFSSSQDAGKIFYGWAVGVEILVLVVGGFSRISTRLTEDRKAGLWDSNRLTPLRPAQILTGYWFAPALREFYMAAVLAGFGLIIVLAGRLPFTLWLGTQTLIAATALFFGLLGLLAGMVMQRSQGSLIFLLLLMTWPFSFMGPSRLLTNFLLPIYGLGNLFSGPGSREWSGGVEFFGVPVPAVLATLVIQLAFGVFVWRALVRKTANPFQPLLLRWEAAALFGILVFTQHALLWDVWRGMFPTVVAAGKVFDRDTLLPVVHGGTLFVGVILLALASPLPEHVRVESLRAGFKNLGAIFSRSAASLAAVLAGLAGLALLTQFLFVLPTSWPAFLVTAFNLAEIFFIFALLLEFCRLRHQRRALGFLSLWIFVLGFIPFILAAVFSSETLARASLLAPGFIALAGYSDPDWLQLAGTVLAHGCVAAVIFFNWRGQWRRLLAAAA